MEEPIDEQTLLEGLEGQPEEVRGLFIYTICETMVRAGTLELVSASTMAGFGTTLIYRNPDTKEVFEILKPELSQEEEDEMHDHIGELLSSQT